VREALPWIKIGASAMTRAPQVDPVRRGLLAAALMAALPAAAADGAITLVVPFAPGGTQHLAAEHVKSLSGIVQAKIERQ
jgi:hypothetical protein